jgi:hypothetical protein
VREKIHTLIIIIIIQATDLPNGRNGHGRERVLSLAAHERGVVGARLLDPPRHAQTAARVGHQPLERGWGEMQAAGDQITRGARALPGIFGVRRCPWWWGMETERPMSPPRKQRDHYHEDDGDDPVMRLSSRWWRCA